MTRLLEVEGLTTHLRSGRGDLRAVDRVSFWLDEGEAFGLVGESGSGKSMTCRSIMRLLPATGAVTSGTVRYRGADLLAMSDDAMCEIRGRDISMIFQDPVGALNPVVRIGEQIMEGLIEHGLASRGEARHRALEMMAAVGIPDATRRFNNYPHEFSGGMCQRVVIAAALACRPKIIIADEPTTQLDVTVQDQILKLLEALQRELGASLILVTHNLAVVAQACQRVAVMYAGQIVEMAPTTEIFDNPRHPYTLGLLDCVPRLVHESERRELRPIPGQPPDLSATSVGCQFRWRCPLATPACAEGELPLRDVAANHKTACIHHDQLLDRRDLWGEQRETRAQRRPA